MLDTRFPRPMGDIGNPATFDFPVLYAVVAGASPQRVVRAADASLLPPFIDAARLLVSQGATAIATSCGFLVLWQRQIQQALDVPVWTSSLLCLPALSSAGVMPNHAGVVTVDAASLTPAHLTAAGASIDTPVAGLSPGCAFQRSLLDNLPTLDTRDAEQQTVAAAQRLLAAHPQLTDIVLECTNMPPYAEAVRRATGRRVHDITTLIAQRLC